MPVVRGDRIGESQKLNRRGVEAQDFYAALVAAVPDDFGRFRLSAAHVALRMYPRREPTPAILRRVQRMLDELGGGEGPLWRTWEVDGVQFAELTGWSRQGNRYHRTPEPPRSSHIHTGACVMTALAQAHAFDEARVEELRALHRATRQGSRGRDGRYAVSTTSTVGTSVRGSVRRPVRDSVPPSPPSPRTTYSPPDPPAGAGGETPAPAAPPTPTSPAIAPTGPGPDRAQRSRQLRDHAAAAEQFWVQLGGNPGPDDRRQVREALRSGVTLQRVLGSVVERVRDQLLARGALGVGDAWPPAGLAPFDPEFSATGAPTAAGDEAGARKAWERVSEALRPRLSTEAWATWIRPCSGLHVLEGRLAVEVPDGQFLDWIGRNWSAELQWAAAASGLEGVDLVMAPPAAIAG